jgi:DNA-binding LacI/PurR family transcriptional regulator
MNSSSTATRKPRAARIPMYKQIEADLREKVREGVWTPGAMLPSRKTLADQYQVDLRTLQSAIVHLLADGTLRADRRRGTFVAQASGAVQDRPANLAGLEPAPAHLPGPYNGEVAARQPFAGPRPRDYGGSVQQPSRFRRARTDTLLGIFAVSWPSDSEFQSIPNAHADWATMVVNSVEQVISDAGGASLFLKRHYNEEDIHIPITEGVARLLDGGARAIAFVNVVAVPGDIDEIAACIERERVPGVMLTWQEIIGTVPHVINDDVNGGYQASNHLLAAGYVPRIVIDPYQRHWSRQRILGAVEGVIHAGLPADLLQVNPNSGLPDGVSVAPHDRDEDAAYDLARKAFDGGLPGGTGIIATNDDAALGVIKAAREAGLVMGRDYGLVGFDDTLRASSASLTSLRPSFDEMGAEVGHMLLRALSGQKIPHQVRLAPRLLARSSTHQGGAW